MIRLCVFAKLFNFGRRFGPASVSGILSVEQKPVLSLRALEGDLDVSRDLDLQIVRGKSMDIIDLFIRLLGKECLGMVLEYLNSFNAKKRRSQVSVSHPEGYVVVQPLIRSRVIADCGESDLMRLGFFPL